MSFGTTFTFSSKQAFRKQNNENKSIVIVNLRPWVKYPENSEVQAQTPPLKGGVLAWTVLFSMATVADYGGKRVKSLHAE